VAPGELNLTLVLENVADEPAPLMFGLHPYFPLRFAAQDATINDGATGDDPALPTAADLVGGDEAGARRSCQVCVDAGTLWDRTRGEPTGTMRSVPAAWDVRRPRSLADLAETAVQAGVASPDGRMPVLLYTDPEALAEASAAQGDPAAPGGVTSGVVDTASGLALTLETSRAFGALALYTPPAHVAVSLEPRSALPDALALATDDPTLATGLRTVSPDTPWHASARVSLATHPPLTP
jgi:galactose mutarotase-like enzyme